MGNWAEEWLVYDTVKVVRIKDKGLGVLYYVLFLLVLAASLSLSLSGRSYLVHTDALVGTGQLVLKEVKSGASAAAVAAARESAEALRSALASTGRPETALRKLSKYEAGTSEGAGGVFLATRVKEAPLLENPSLASAARAQGKDDEAEHDSFVEGADGFLLRVVHAFHAPGWASSAGKDVPGELVGPDGEVLAHFPAGESDKLSLAQLLRAAGAPRALEEPSGEAGREGETIRSRGAHLALSVSYYNLGAGEYSPGEVRYRYTVAWVKGSPAVRYYSRGCSCGGGAGSETAVKAYGVRITLHVGGRIHSSSWSGAAASLGSSLGLIGIVTTLIDVIVVYVSKLKNIYCAYKFEVTKKID